MSHFGDTTTPIDVAKLEYNTPIQVFCHKFEIFAFSLFRSFPVFSDFCPFWRDFLTQILTRNVGISGEMLRRKGVFV